jgi:uncharacterized OB-fold protein
MSPPNSAAYAGPLPVLDDANAPFWEAARRGERRVQRCLDCGAHRFPAGHWCPACRGERTEWARVSGRGTVDSFCVFHKPYFPGLDAPYNVAVVTLEEGARLFSNVVGVADGRIAVGMAVVATFDAVTPEVTLVRFRPAATDGGGS